MHSHSHSESQCTFTTPRPELKRPTQCTPLGRREMHNGMVVAAFALTDVRPGDGGFCAIPGSHKSHYPRPGECQSTAQLAADGALAQPAVQVRASDVVPRVHAHSCR